MRISRLMSFLTSWAMGTFCLNTVNFLAAEEKQIIIRKTDKNFEPMLLTGWTTLVVFVVSVILLPLTMLCAGVAVYLRRRALK